jgi:hypothetical protein
LRSYWKIIDGVENSVGTGISVTADDPPKLLRNHRKVAKTTPKALKTTVDSLSQAVNSETPGTMDVGLFPRYSKSGRRITDHYQYETSLEDITHSPNRKEVDDLKDHNGMTESKLETEKRKENLVKIQQFVRKNGYDTVLDVFLDELVMPSHRREKKKIRQALNDGGIAKILSFSYSRSISDTPVIQQEICRYAGMIFEKEIDQLVRSNELRAPMQVLQY